MDSDHVEQLAQRVSALQVLIVEFGTGNLLSEIKALMHHPGYTSPVELQLTNALMDAMEGSMANMRQLHDALLESSRAIVAGAASPAELASQAQNPA
jgi:hypothetical protein